MELNRHIEHKTSSYTSSSSSFKAGKAHISIAKFLCIKKRMARYNQNIHLEVGSSPSSAPRGVLTVLTVPLLLELARFS